MHDIVLLNNKLYQSWLDLQRYYTGDEDKNLQHIMATHGTIGAFEPSNKTWVSYAERLEQYFVANDVDAADKKRAILLSVCGATTYQLIRNLVAPAKPTSKSFDELVKLVKEHHQPPPSVTLSVVKAWVYRSPRPTEVNNHIHNSLLGTRPDYVELSYDLPHPINFSRKIQRCMYVINRASTS